jgi:outer membrane protein assembly factor BamB
MMRNSSICHHCIIGAIAILMCNKLGNVVACGQGLSVSDLSAVPGVSVPDSSLASELLAKASEKEAKKDWKAAGDLYGQMSNELGNRVVLLHFDDANVFCRYQGVALAAQEKISKWPTEGFTQYNELYNSVAKALLSKTSYDDIDAASDIYLRFFATAAGKESGIRLIDIDIENGHFGAAAAIGKRLLSLHPALGNDRPMILYRTALASHWAGDDTSAKLVFSQLKRESPDAEGMIGQQKVVLSEKLSQALQSPCPVSRYTLEDLESCPTFGATVDRGEATENVKLSELSVEASVPFAAATYPGIGEVQKDQYQQLDRSGMTRDTFTGVMPVIDAGDIFFQDGRCLKAINGTTGKPLPGWLETYRGSDAGVYKVDTFGRARNEQLTLTVTPSMVLAVMGQPDVSWTNADRIQKGLLIPASRTKLVCLDRKTGKELWAKTTLDLPEQTGSGREGQFRGTPLFVPDNSASGKGDSVLIVVHDDQPNGFDDCYVVCLSLRTGEYRWTTYAGGGARQQQSIAVHQDVPSQLALYQGHVYVMTNRGTVACLNPGGGQMLWLDSYQHSNGLDKSTGVPLNRYGQVFDFSDRGKRAWKYNPLFMSKGHMFALPGDANTLYVFDTETGEIQKQIPMSHFDDADVLLGIHDESICLTSDHDFYAVDWQKFDDTLPLRTCISWSEINFTSGESNDICGRGFLDNHSLYIPARQCLYQLDCKAQRIVDVYPPDGLNQIAAGSNVKESGAKTSQPKNLLISGKNLIVAKPSQIVLYH